MFNISDKNRLSTFNGNINQRAAVRVFEEKS